VDKAALIQLTGTSFSQTVRFPRESSVGTSTTCGITEVQEGVADDEQVAVRRTSSFPDPYTTALLVPASASSAVCTKVSRTKSASTSRFVMTSQVVQIAVQHNLFNMMHAKTHHRCSTENFRCNTGVTN
jgi:hypothetical protein